MTTRTWVGGGSNDASDPSQWNPAGVPQRGDVANMTGGTMRLGNTDPLNGVQLEMPTIGTTQELDVNATDHLQFATQIGVNTTVNLADKSHWIGGFANGYGGHTTINATGSGEWDNGTSLVSGDTTVGAPVEGLGSITDEASHSSANLEFQREVGVGQVVAIEGGYGPASHGVVTVDGPSSYHATRVMGFG